MNQNYIQELDSFTIENLPNLDVVVMGALELLSQTDLPKIDISMYKRPLVVGSGNAEITGRIVFEKIDAVFASESSFEEKLANIPEIDGVVLISASGEKHAPIIASKAKELGKKVTLITTSPNSSASKVFADDKINFTEYIFPKNREPYTYNTSTYMGMILGATGEQPAEIKTFIDEVVSKLSFPNFKEFNKYYVVIPSHLSQILPMITIKFVELFGRNIARDIETYEYLKLHATTVVPSDELFISFGQKNDLFGDDDYNLFVPLPENANYGTMMAIGYWLVGQIQAAYPNYFKDNIAKYTEKVSQILGKTISPIVEK